MMHLSSSTLLLVLGALVAGGCSAAAQAQPAKPAAPAQNAAPANLGPPNALQGFSKNQNEPVQIEAASLDVRDKDKVATFTGNVHVIQGDTDLRTKKLIVFYENDDSPKTDAQKAAIKAAQPGPGGASQIRRLEAIGDVFVTQKDQTAQGEKGVFDMKTNTITLTGNPVVVADGKSVLRGERLVVDRTTGLSRMEGGRVQGIFQRSPKEEGSTAPKLPGTN
jgi:lipopolysaccharide export system protein LptA